MKLLVPDPNSLPCLYIYEKVPVLNGLVVKLVIGGTASNTAHRSGEARQVPHLNPSTVAVAHAPLHSCVCVCGGGGGPLYRAAYGSNMNTQ
jgi:hypothetical protein